MANRSVEAADFGKALTEQLTLYHEDVIEKVNAAGDNAVKALVKKTRATAPQRRGAFKKSITSVTTENPVTGDKEYTWGVKAPHHRLTHLLVHGHQAPNGGRVPGDPFLENALNEVLPAYEAAIEEALKK